VSAAPASDPRSESAAVASDPRAEPHSGPTAAGRRAAGAAQVGEQPSAPAPAPGRVTVYRFDPERDAAPYRQTFEFPFEQGMNALDVALHIQQQLDGTFTFGYCCRNSHCGLCGVLVNGRPGLLCREPATRDMTLEPLDGLPVLRDLAIDRAPYEERLLALRLFLDRDRPAAEEPEWIAPPDQERFKVASRCVGCYLCLSACPVFAENPHGFLGPAGFAQLGRHAFDPRDTLDRHLLAASAGAHLCTGCGACDDVCPPNVRPRGIVAELNGSHT
jgi:fumarate reductase iron-sulfur subunit